MGRIQPWGLVGAARLGGWSVRGLVPRSLVLPPAPVSTGTVWRVSVQSLHRASFLQCSHHIAALSDLVQPEPALVSPFL